MKKVFGALIGFLLAAPILSIAAEAAPKGVEMMAPGLVAPNTVFANPNGTPAIFDNFKGKVLVLNVWATWCGPCIKEMPSLDRLASKLDPNKALVLAVSQDNGGAAVARPFLDKIGVQNLSAYSDPSRKLSRDLGIRGLPTTFLLSPTGSIVARIEGPLDWDNPDIVRFIQSSGGN